MKILMVIFLILILYRGYLLGKEIEEGNNDVY